MDFSVINEENYDEIIAYMKSLSDEKYRDFHSKLIPDVVSKQEVMGIRLPVLRKLAKDIAKGDCESYLSVSGTAYYEESMLRGLVISMMKLGYDDMVEKIDGFLPYINNWAVCDTFCSSMKAVRKHRVSFFEHINTYLNSNECFTVRVGLIMMMSHFLEDEYIDEVLHRADCVKSEEYYANMACAWLVATAYSKYPQKTKNFLINCNLDDVTFNMTVRKCIESYRISKEDKDFLRNFKANGRRL